MMEQLLEIKAFREQRAAAEMHRRRLAVEQRQRLLEAARKKLAAHRDYRREREDTGFAAIRGQAVALRRLEDLRAESARLREAEALLHQAVLAAEEKLRQARTAWEESRGMHAAAAREKEKIEQLARMEKETMILAQNRKEEAELEEHANPARH